MDDEIDATILEILPEDNISEDKYLYPDLNYTNGFDNYIEDKIIFTAGYPDLGLYKGEKHYSGGEIIGIRHINKHNYHFFHKCSTKEGSSGSPLVNPSLQVVGIHYGGNKKESRNFGIFVGVIIDILNSEYKENKINFKAKIIEKEEKKIKEEILKDKKCENDNNSKGFINNNKNEKINNYEIKEISIKKQNDKKNIDKEENIKNNIPKNGGNDFLIKVLSKVEKNNDQNPIQISDSDMALMNQIYNNPSLMTIMKTLSKDPKIFEQVNKMPEIQELKKANPIIEEAFNNPKLMDEILDPKIFRAFNEVTSIINNNKKVKEEDKFNQLKNMGFKNDDLIREALLLCKGNIEEAKEYILSACKENKK